MADRPSRIRQRLSFGPRTVGYMNDTIGLNEVTFIVEGKQFKVHVDILREASPVFHQMLTEDSPFLKQDFICVDDISASAFKLFIRMLYAGTRSVSVMMTPKDSLDCLIIANRYLMGDLENFLRTQLLRNVTYSNVLKVIPYCNLNLNLWSIRSRCWSVIETNTAQVVASNDFKSVSWVLLREILENSRLIINEYALFCAVKKWAEYQKHVKDEYKAKSIIEVIGIAIYSIRFPLMTKREFELVEKTGLLNKGELKDLKRNFRKNATFSHQKRQNVCKCRNSGQDCRLCCSVTQSCAKGTKISRRKFAYAGSRLPSTSRDENSNVVDVKAMSRVNSSVPTCECFKYVSCPAFPNGTTANILRKAGFTFV